VRESAWFDCSNPDFSIPGKLRRNLRRLRKQLDEQGTQRWEQVSEGLALEQAFREFLKVEAAGWKGRESSGTAIGLSPVLERFYHAVMMADDLELKPSINLLWLDEKCIAAQFTLQTKECLSLLKIGYDEEYARFSPGSLLLENVLEQAIEESIDKVSLVSSPPWAQRWNPENMHVWQLTHYNDNTAGNAVRYLDNIKQLALSRIKHAG